LSAISPAQINKSARFKNRVAREIKQALRGLGYYQVLIEFEDKFDGKDYVLLAKITAGKYVFIEVADLQLNGEAVRDAEFLALQKAKAPRKGERMHHGIYEDYKKALLSLSHRKGYFDAEFSRAELEVTPGDRRGKMHLHFQSGPRYRFGEIKFVGGQIRDARLQTLLPFKSGDFYSAERLAKLSQNLANTLWFGSVDLIADPDNRKDGALPLTIELQPAVKNTVETGIGYATDVGARIKTSWFKPWVNDRGHSLNADLALSQREQYLETSYKFPLRDVANDYYQLSFGYKNKDLLDTDSTSYNLKGERHWLLSNQWQRTLSLRWLYEDYVQGAQRDTSNLVLPGFAFSRNRDTGGSMPLDADNYLLSVEAANTSWGSDTDFVRLYGRAGWIGSFSEDQRWLVRLDAGAILQEQIANIPPSLRFFAGGDSSLRGYGYQTIAPVNAEQELIGGIRLATVNLEYQHRVKGDWWLALFTDYGSAWNDQPDWKQSVGIGARWASPVGPIRLDLAYGMDHEPNGRFRIHFTLGPEL
jgi:translocation and assembly module TamA